MRPGDVVILNDPYAGGTHLPDVTAVAPVHVGTRLVGFIANRAHHADIGGRTPAEVALSIMGEIVAVRRGVSVSSKQ